MLTRVDVNAPSGAYPIWIDPDPGAEARLADALVIECAGGARLGLITDETVARLHAPRVAAALRARGLDPAVVVVADGESSKSLGTVERVAEALVGAGLDRRALLVALGGGVVGDLAGFVASIFLRGIGCVQAPTTLLAQVDSSVGGKTGVNLPSGKNLIGTFSQPRLVYLDVTALATLSPRDRASGLAELLKHGAIADAELFALVEEHAEKLRAGDPALTAELIARSLRVKAAIVATDERETRSDAEGGGRARLNFGHTVGHALESASFAGDDPLRHGEAVALGMLAAARVGAALGAGDRDLEARLLALLPRLGLPIALDARLDAATLARAGADKKRAGAQIKFVVVDRIGSSRLVPVEPKRLGEILLKEKS